MKKVLTELRKKVVIGFVGGSDISKQYEQLGSTSKWLSLYYIFDVLVSTHS